MQPKPGWKTTEFWATVAANVGNVTAALAGSLSPSRAALVSAISVAAYTIGRSLVKAPPPTS